MYAKLLLHMLKQRTIDGPFLGRPPLGPLPSLPPDMVRIVTRSLSLNIAISAAVKSGEELTV